MRISLFRCRILFFILIGATNTHLFSHNKTSKHSAITYKLHGRFGDQLKTYVKAKLLSCIFDIPLLYKQGTYFDQLVMHTEERHYSTKDENRFKKIVNLDGKKDDVLLNVDSDDSTLYVVHPFFVSKLLNFSTIKKNTSIMEKLKRMISPRFQLQEVCRPSDCITVAVHVRKGGGFDKTIPTNKETQKKLSPAQLKQYADLACPWKFPPDQFYIDQIKTISSLFYDQPLYVHIFTDDPCPANIVAQYKKAVDKPNITFACRDANSHDTNVLEDFFSMAKFDCLIRPVSWLSVMAELIGDHKVVISSKSCKSQGASVVVKHVDVYIKDELKDKLNPEFINQKCF